MQNIMTGRLQTMPPRSGTFFITIILTPLAIGLLIVAPLKPIAWIVILAGGLSFFDCLRRLKVSYQMDAAGIKRNRLGGCDELPWQQVQAVGTQEIHSKFGLEAIVVRVCGPTKSFRPMLRPDTAALFLEQLRERCPAALRINEDTAQIDAPVSGDNDLRSSLIARHKLRLRIEHAVALAGWSLLFVPCLVSASSALRTGAGMAHPARLAALTAVIFLALASGDLAALWRLRK